jgi:hypothetical protein
MSSEVEPDKSESSPNESIQRALVALFALRAITGAQPHVAYRILPEQGILPLDQAAQQLARLPKPQRCSGTTTAREVLDLICSQVDPTADAKYRFLASRLQAGEGAMAQVYRLVEREEVTPLRIIGPSETMRSSATALVGWHREYVLDSPYSLAVHLDSDESTEDVSSVAVYLGPSAAFGTDLDWDSSQ